MTGRVAVIGDIAENKVFEEIDIGDSASMTRALDKGDIETWAAMTGDINLIDLDPGPADTSMFTKGGTTRLGAGFCSLPSQEPNSPA